MPNWCSCTLEVFAAATDDEEPLREFREAAWVDEGNTLSLTKLIPPAVPADDVGIDILEWQRVNWGTKWDLDATIDLEHDAYIMYRFDSAWSPPEEAVRTLSSRYPTLEFSLEFDEPSNDFWGTREYLGGMCTDRLDGVSPTAAQWREEDEEYDGLQMLREGEEDLPDE